MLLGSERPASREQSLNAHSPKSATASGIVTLTRFVHPVKAQRPTLTTPSGITTSPFTPRTSSFPSFDSNKPFTDE